MTLGILAWEMRQMAVVWLSCRTWWWAMGSVGEKIFEGDDEFGFGHVALEGPMGYPSGAVQQVLEGLSLELKRES